MKNLTYCITRLRLATACLAALLLCSCVSSFSTGTTQLSRGLVEQRLVKGKTTKAEVRALLGEPQSITSGSFVNSAYPPAETWTYTKTFYRDAAEMGAGHAIAYGLATGGYGIYDRVEVSVLMVIFDPRGRVMRHIFSQSAAGAARPGGLAQQ
jgi:outer membrane protein assembly factor BamE (lipoprotein component of BamABCDE complex)